MNLMYVTILLFAVTAAFGLAILLKWLSKKEVSKAVVYSHGIFAALGLVLLIVFALQHRYRKAGGGISESCYQWALHTRTGSGKI